MNLQEMTNEQFLTELYFHLGNLNMYDEVKRRLRLQPSVKQPYQIKYKFLPNDRDIDDTKALTVWGTSPLAACQTLVDANDWRGHDMEFLVDITDRAFINFTSADLE